MRADEKAKGATKGTKATGELSATAKKILAGLQKANDKLPRDEREPHENLVERAVKHAAVAEE